MREVCVNESWKKKKLFCFALVNVILRETSKQIKFRGSIELKNKWSRSFSLVFGPRMPEFCL